MHLSDLKNLHVERARRHGRHQRGRRRQPHAQAGADLRAPEEPGEEGGSDLRRRNAGGAARRLRLPALAGYFIPRRARTTSTCQPVADPALQSAHRRHDRRRDPDAEGRRALLRAGQGRQGQRRAARELQAQDPLREPDAATTRPSTSSSSATSRPKKTSPAASSTSSRRSARDSAA